VNVISKNIQPLNNVKNHIAKVPEDIQLEIQSFIDEALKSGACVSAVDVKHHLDQCEFDIQYDIRKLQRILNQLGFEYGPIKEKDKNYNKNAETFIERRFSFIDDLLNNNYIKCTQIHSTKESTCGNGAYDVVYLDESYVNKNHSYSRGCTWRD